MVRKTKKLPIQDYLFYEFNTFFKKEVCVNTRPLKNIIHQSTTSKKRKISKTSGKSIFLFFFHKKTVALRTSGSAFLMEKKGVVLYFLDYVRNKIK